ncbi:MAG TPA: ABC transporter substrate-binding protein [Burkholderiales bacterium]|nr:ABC transporter substrate-binding protein [Burkholderiales bacterium]
MRLTLACGRYDRTQALLDGRVRVEGVDELVYLALRPGETFWRMLNHEEFDASEMSLSSYTILRSEGDERFVALPVFPSRVFRHNALYVRAGSAIRDPRGLKGKRVGVGDYQMTAAVWTRGFLQHEYGVRPEEVTWIVGRPIRAIRPPQGIAVELLPEGESFERMLERGEIDALMSVMIPEGLGRSVERLIPDFRGVEQDYFRKTGIFPIMHTLVLRRAVYEANPWLAVGLYRAFCRARDLALAHLYDTDALTVSSPWIIDELERGRAVKWDYSIEGSRPTLEALVQYLDEQQLTRRRMKVEELFAPNISPALADYLRATGED